MHKLIVILLFFVVACSPPLPPAGQSQQTVVDTEFVSRMGIKPPTVSVIDTPTYPPRSVPSEPIPEKDNTLSLEIKENITLDKSLTFYHYLPTSNNGFKSDKVFYFLLEKTSLTLQQYDKNMSLTLQGDFIVSKPWTRILTIDYNILKTSLSSSNNKDIAFEIGLKNSKVSYVKLGENKFYAKEPIVAPKISIGKNYNQTEYHIINPGENLKLLAESNCITVRSILDLNPKIDSRKNYVVYPGERIRIK